MEGEAVANINRARAEAGIPPITVKEHRQFLRWKNRRNALAAAPSAAILGLILWYMGNGIRHVYLDFRHAQAVEHWKDRPLTCVEATRVFDAKWKVETGVARTEGQYIPESGGETEARALRRQADWLNDKADLEMICSDPGYRSNLEQWRGLVERPPAGP